MSEFSLDEFGEHIKKFYRVKKLILKNRPVSTNIAKVNEYIASLVETYNSILNYTNEFYAKLPADHKNKTISKIKHCRELLVRCFGKLNCRVHVPENIESFEFIVQTVLTESEDDSDCESEPEVINEQKNIESEKVTMATIAEKKTFLSMCATMIRDNYDGSPLTLESFLDKIELIQELTETKLESTLFSFIKSKLESKAREALPDNISSIEELKTALKTGIKPDNSKVIAGKIAALTVRNNNFTDFTKQAEDLADALKRSLILEGITKAKAHEMAIEQTVTVCRLNTKSTLVKSILASTRFADPKEVVAKLVVEQSNEAKEHQVLSFRAQNRNMNSNRYQHNSYRGNNNNGHRNNSYRGNNRRNSNNRNYHNTNNNSTNRGNYRNNNRNNYKNGYTQNENQKASVRALNLETPQQSPLREEQNY